MNTRKALMLALGILLSTGPVAWAAAPAASADRPPSLAERAQIEQKLRQLGYVSWGDIELEARDGLWEVDDALTTGGAEFELRLRPGTLEVVSQRPD